MKEFTKDSTNNEYSSMWLKAVSMLSMIAAILIFWLPQYRVGRNVLFVNLAQIPLINKFNFATIPLDLKPNLITGIIGLLIVAPLYIRGILYWKRASVYNILNFCLNLCLASTIAVICFGNVKGSILNAIWFVKDIKVILFVLALLLSWIGIRAFAGITYIILFIFISLNVTVVNEGMAFNGFLYILFGVLGLITQRGLGPVQLFQGAVDTFTKPARLAKDSIKESKAIIPKRSIIQKLRNKFRRAL